MDWIDIAEELPSIGQWVLVTIDRSKSECWNEQLKPRYSVFAAKVHDISLNSGPYWFRGLTFEDSPIWETSCVTHWQAYPDPFVEE